MDDHFCGCFTLPYSGRIWKTVASFSLGRGGGTLCGIQSLVLVLHSAVPPGGTRGPYVVLGIDPGSVPSLLGAARW